MFKVVSYNLNHDKLYSYYGNDIRQVKKFKIMKLYSEYTEMNEQVIDGWPELREIHITSRITNGKVIIKNCPKVSIINCEVKYEYINNYPADKIPKFNKVPCADMMCEILSYLPVGEILRLYAKSAYFNHVLKTANNRIGRILPAVDHNLPYYKLPKGQFITTFYLSKLEVSSCLLFGDLYYAYDSASFNENDIIHDDYQLIIDTGIHDTTEIFVDKFKIRYADYSKLHYYDIKRVIPYVINKPTSDGKIMMLNGENNRTINRAGGIDFLILKKCTDITVKCAINNGTIINKCHDIKFE